MMPSSSTTATTTATTTTTTAAAEATTRTSTNNTTGKTISVVPLPSFLRKRGTWVLIVFLVSVVLYYQLFVEFGYLHNYIDYTRSFVASTTTTTGSSPQETKKTTTKTTTTTNKLVRREYLELEPLQVFEKNGNNIIHFKH